MLKATDYLSFHCSIDADLQIIILATALIKLSHRATADWSLYCECKWVAHATISCEYVAQNINTQLSMHDYFILCYLRRSLHRTERYAHGLRRILYYLSENFLTAGIQSMKHHTGNYLSPAAIARSFYRIFKSDISLCNRKPAVHGET